MIQPRVSRRVARRRIMIGARLYTVEVSEAGISFRQYRTRFTLLLPWRNALGQAEKLAGDDRWAARELARRGIRDRRRLP